MIRVGVGKPHIVEAEDRWNVPTGRYYVPDFCWLTPNQWHSLQKYQESYERELVRRAEENFAAGKPPLDAEMVRLVEGKLDLNPQRSTLWQFEGLTRQKDDYVRHVAILGQPTLVEWTWWEAEVLYPLLCAKAWLLNHQPRSKREGCGGCVIGDEGQCCGKDGPCGQKP